MGGVKIGANDETASHFGGSSCPSVRENAIERWSGTGRVKSPQKSVEDSFVVTSLTKDGCDSKG